MIQSNRQNPNKSLISSFANSIVQKSQRTPAKNNFLINTSTFYSTAAPSQTQSQIYSHILIRQIMEERQRNTIRHDINQINQDTQLYKLPLKYDKKQFQVNAIPAENELFTSLCSVTLKNIKQGIKSQRVKYSDLNNNKINQKQRQNIKNPKISASGLTSFKFSSVKAKQSLGLGKLNYQQIMKKQLSQNRRRLNSASQRNNRILQRRTTDHKYKCKLKQQNEIMSLKNISTSAYLKNIQKMKQHNGKIFNQSLKKTNFVKEYMQRQIVDYDQASHAINVIQQITKIKEPIKQKLIKKAIVIDQIFQNRKLPVKRKSVQVKNFYFIE